MSLEWEQVIVDARNPAELGRWWQQALRWVVVDEDAEAYEIRPAPEQLPGLLFVRVPEVKSIKNGCTSTSVPTTAMRRSSAFYRSARLQPMSGRASRRRGSPSPTPRATSSVC